MITICIAGEERRFEDVQESWINQQINRRRQDGKPICIQVSIRQGSINLLLSTPACSSGTGGSRIPNRDENQVLDLWRRRGLNDIDFSSGNVVAFLKQMKQIFG
jgi:hypothetical protein